MNSFPIEKADAALLKASRERERRAIVFGGLIVEEVDDIRLCRGMCRGTGELSVLGLRIAAGEGDLEGGSITPIRGVSSASTGSVVDVGLGGFSMKDTMTFPWNIFESDVSLLASRMRSLLLGIRVQALPEIFTLSYAAIL